MIDRLSFRGFMFYVLCFRYSYTIAIIYSYEPLYKLRIQYLLINRKNRAKRDFLSNQYF